MIKKILEIKNKDVFISLLAGIVAVIAYVAVKNIRPPIETVFALMGCSAGVVASLEAIVIIVRHFNDLGKLSGMPAIPAGAGVLGLLFYSADTLISLFAN